MQNTVPVVSIARQPRGMVKVGGTPMPGWVRFEVDNNSFYQADTFRVEFVATRLPKDRGMDWWAVQTDVTVEVLAGFPSDPDNFQSIDLKSLILGRVDEVDWDPVSGILAVSGRDLTSYFIDTKTTQTWVNHTASQIAEELATKYGMAHDNITPTDSKVGSYYQNDHVLVTNQHSEWDLLTYLAAKESFVVYCQGNALHFEPKPERSTNPYLLQWVTPNQSDSFYQYNGKSLRLSRSLTLAKGVVVWVQYVSLKTGKSQNVSYPQNKAKGTAPGQSSPHAEVHTIRSKKKLTPDDALALAIAKHKELSQHELRLSATLPADNLLTATAILQLQGTGTDFDQIYYPESVTRYMSVNEGYSMTVSAKNVAKVNEVTL